MKTPQEKREAPAPHHVCRCQSLLAEARKMQEGALLNVGAKQELCDTVQRFVEFVVFLCCGASTFGSLSHATHSRTVGSPFNTTKRTSTRSPSSASLPFLGEGSPTKIDYSKKYPYSSLSTGGPSKNIAIANCFLSSVQTFLHRQSQADCQTREHGS